MKAVRRLKSPSKPSKFTSKEKKLKKKTEKRKVSVKVESTENECVASTSSQSEGKAKEKRRRENVQTTDPQPAGPSDISTPLVREVPPLEPIYKSDSSEEEAWKRKRLERLGNEERVLLRQDRIWQNEERRRARLLSPKAQQAPEAGGCNLRIVTYTKARVPTESFK